MKPVIVLGMIHIGFALLLLAITIVVAKFRRVLCYYLYAVFLLTTGAALCLIGNGYYSWGYVALGGMLIFFIGGFILDLFDSYRHRHIG